MIPHYSQGDEEEKILEYFSGQHPMTTRFLDIGAHDGLHFSNTYKLATLGWGGVCVEGSAHAFKYLVACHQHNSNIQCINKIIDVDSHLASFYNSIDNISSLSKEFISRWKDSTFVESQEQTLSINGLFDLIGIDFSFISIDIEGSTFDVFSKFNFDTLTKLQLICVEHDGGYHTQHILDVIKPFGFSLWHCSGENLLLGK